MKFVALALLVGCGSSRTHADCPDGETPWDRIVVTDASGEAHEDELAYLRKVIDDFSTWSGRCGLHVDEVQVLEDPPYRSKYQGHYWPRGRTIEMGLYNIELVLRGGLCKALDYQEGISSAHRDTLLELGREWGEDDPAEYLLRICRLGPADLGLVSQLEDLCPIEWTSEWERFTRKTVWTHYVDDPGPTETVAWTAKRTAVRGLPSSAAAPLVVMGVGAGGIYALAAPLDFLPWFGRYPNASVPELDVYRIDPVAGDLDSLSPTLHAPAVDEYGEALAWWSILHSEADPYVLSTDWDGTATAAWRIRDDALEPVDPPMLGDLWASGVVDVNGDATIAGLHPVSAYPKSRLLDVSLSAGTAEESRVSLDGPPLAMYSATPTSAGFLSIGVKEPSTRELEMVDIDVASGAATRIALPRWADGLATKLPDGRILIVTDLAWGVRGQVPVIIDPVRGTTALPEGDCDDWLLDDIGAALLVDDQPMLFEYNGDGHDALIAVTVE